VGLCPRVQASGLHQEIGGGTLLIDCVAGLNPAAARTCRVYVVCVGACVCAREAVQNASLTVCVNRGPSTNAQRRLLVRSAVSWCAAARDAAVAKTLEPRPRALPSAVTAPTPPLPNTQGAAPGHQLRRRHPARPQASTPPVMSSHMLMTSPICAVSSVVQSHASDRAPCFVLAARRIAQGALPRPPAAHTTGLRAARTPLPALRSPIPSAAEPQPASAP
jgi:hypothetical protein